MDCEVLREETSCRIRAVQCRDHCRLEVAATRIGLDQVVWPVANASRIILVNAAGGGWIHLPFDGWWFFFSVMLFILASDLWGYLLHRASINVPCVGHALAPGLVSREKATGFLDGIIWPVRRKLRFHRPSRLLLQVRRDTYWLTWAQHSSF
jgi:hypothetical protein